MQALARVHTSIEFQMDSVSDTTPLLPETSHKSTWIYIRTVLVVAGMFGALIIAVCVRICMRENKNYFYLATNITDISNGTYMHN